MEVTRFDPVKKRNARERVPVGDLYALSLM